VSQDSRVFPPFRLDSKNEQLWRENKEIRLRRKTFAVLRYLVERPGELVTKAALLDEVWPDVSVSDSMPAISVRELRKALGDDAQSPRFIETVQGRGYRFIAEVKSFRPSAQKTAVRRSSLSSHPAHNAIVGRRTERSTLSAALADARKGHGRLTLISGEPGIGKSRLCVELAAEAEARGMSVLIGRCSEQEAVPLLPFIEILEAGLEGAEPDDLRRLVGDEGPQLARMLPKLRRMIPDLPPAPELEPRAARRVLFDSVCDFLARCTRERPTMIVVEDLHWADASTLDLFSHISQRHAEIPILLIGTHRSSDSDLGPAFARLLEDLVRGRKATQLALTGLSASDVAGMLKGLRGRRPRLGS